MDILGIETSCDETAAAVVRSGREVLSNVVYTQIPLHQPYGGVVPEIASRKHIEAIYGLADQALAHTGLTRKDIDAVAVTYAPGLIGAVLVGVNFAKAAALALNKPLIPVHHIRGHIAANYIAYPELEPPFVSLVASGGHSHILHIKDYRSFDVIGATTDDAAGEAFDKAARVLGLGYPGGPKLNALAKEGNPEAIRFPRPHNGYDFSFSGLKSAVLNYLNGCQMKGETVNEADVAASFQKANFLARIHFAITQTPQRRNTANISHDKIQFKTPSPPYPAVSKRTAQSKMVEAQAEISKDRKAIPIRKLLRNAISAIATNANQTRPTTQPNSARSVIWALIIVRIPGISGKRNADAIAPEFPSPTPEGLAEKS